MAVRKAHKNRCFLHFLKMALFWVRLLEFEYFWNKPCCNNTVSSLMFLFLFDVLLIYSSWHSKLLSVLLRYYFKIYLAVVLFRKYLYLLASLIHARETLNSPSFPNHQVPRKIFVLLSTETINSNGE